MKDIRCIVCRTEFKNDELESSKGCPVCGYQGLTMFVDGDINIDINWFELRLICMWAESLALQVGDSHSINAFYGAIKAIKDQLPECGQITMFDESPDIEVIEKPDEVEVPKGTLFN